MNAQTPIAAEPLTYRGLPCPHPQLYKLEALAAAIDRVLLQALTGEAFESVDGIRLVNAAYDVFEVDGLYDMADGLARDLGVTLDGSPILHLEDSAPRFPEMRALLSRSADHLEAGA